MLKSDRMGPVLLLSGLVGGGLLWVILVDLRFWYLINNVPGKDIGEAIWVLDPEYTLIAAVPGLILTLFGLLISFIEENQKSPNGF